VLGLVLSLGQEEENSGYKFRTKTFGTDLLFTHSTNIYSHSRCWGYSGDKNIQ
jgi:hypothetical protein